MAILTDTQTWRRVRRSRRQASGDLTETEQAHVKAALRRLSRSMGRARAAQALGMSANALNIAQTKRRRVTVKLALMVARLTGVTVEEIISGAWLPTCPHCGGTGRASQIVSGTK